jgi:ABC-type sulfate transport system permease subunit
VASLLCLLALVTLIAKHAVERKMGQHAVGSTRELIGRQVI